MSKPPYASSVVAASTLLVVTQHAQLVQILNEKLGERLAGHLGYLASHLTKALRGKVTTVTNEVKERHRRAGVFTTHDDIAQFILDVTALMAKTAEMPSDKTNVLLDGLAYLHTFRYGCETLEERAKRAYDTLTALGRGEATGEVGALLAVNWLRTDAAKNALLASAHTTQELVDACRMLLDMTSEAGPEEAKPVLTPLLVALELHS